MIENDNDANALVQALVQDPALLAMAMRSASDKMRAEGLTEQQIAAALEQACTGPDIDRAEG